MGDRSRRRATVRTTHSQLVASTDVNTNEKSSTYTLYTTAASTSTTAKAEVVASSPFINRPITSVQTTSSNSPLEMTKKSIRSHEKEKKIKHGPIKERWLLTRKTWKYMADAGRKLIPDGAVNKSEDIPKIEEYFQKVCKSEQKFLPWRRKSSYPGALTSLRRKRRQKHVATTSPPKASSADEAEDESRSESQHLLVMIHMLEKYLNIADTDFRNEYNSNDNDKNQKNYGIGDSNSCSSSYINSGGDIGKINGPNENQLSRTTAFSPLKGNEQISQLKESTNDLSVRNTKLMSESETNIMLAQNTSTSSSVNNSHKSNEQLKQNWLAEPYNYRYTTCDARFAPITSFDEQLAGDLTSAYTTKRSSDHSTWAANMHTSLLLESLRNYSRTNRNPLVTYDRVTDDVLKDKQLLRQIRDELKQQQIQRLFRRHSSRSSVNLLGSSINTSKSSLFNFWQKEHRDSSNNISGGGGGSGIPLFNTMDTSYATSINKSLDASKDADKTITDRFVDRQHYSFGIQTDPMPMMYLRGLYNEYKSKEAAEERDACGDLPQTNKHSRRKSSIDNEDVSQSVSDTIKRYLRMARKKSVNDADGNRFRRVNYDQNLRNIKAKGETTMPGDDDGNMKGSQTDLDWIVLVMKEIEELGREIFAISLDSTDCDVSSSAASSITTGHAITAAAAAATSVSVVDGNDNISGILHLENINTHRGKHRNYFNYTSPVQSSKSTSTSPTHSSPPSPSPSGLFHSGTQFLSNLLWHGHDKQQQQQPLPPHQQQPQNPQQIQQSDQQQTIPPNDNSKSLFSVTLTAQANHPSITMAATQGSNTATTMQKSKSSSNVGQTFTKKIWKSRSKSQTRTTQQTNISDEDELQQQNIKTEDKIKPLWMPQVSMLFVQRKTFFIYIYLCDF